MPTFLLLRICWRVHIKCVERIGFIASDSLSLSQDATEKVDVAKQLVFVCEINRISKELKFSFSFLRRGVLFYQFIIGNQFNLSVWCFM